VLLFTRFPSGKKSPSGNERDDHHALAITLAAGPGSFVTIPGGLPIIVDGHCIGAVGASGAAKHDVDIAQAGIDAFERMWKGPRTLTVSAQTCSPHLVCNTKAVKIITRARRKAMS
jgi:hypothetical protein